MNMLRISASESPWVMGGGSGAMVPLFTDPASMTAKQWLWVLSVLEGIEAVAVIVRLDLAAGETLGQEFLRCGPR